MLTSSHSCAVVVLWVRAVYSDCLPLLPSTQIRAGTLVARSTSLSQTSSTATHHQDAGFTMLSNLAANTVSVVTIQRADGHHASALGASPGHHKLPSLPAVHCTDHVLLDECEALSTDSPPQDESRRSSGEFAECACIQTTSGFLKCVVARSATMLILPDEQLVLTSHTLFPQRSRTQLAIALVTQNLCKQIVKCSASMFPGHCRKAEFTSQSMSSSLTQEHNISGSEAPMSSKTSGNRTVLDPTRE